MLFKWLYSVKWIKFFKVLMISYWSILFFDFEIVDLIFSFFFNVLNCLFCRINNIDKKCFIKLFKYYGYNFI